MANIFLRAFSFTGLRTLHIYGFGVPFIGFGIGGYIDYQENLRLTMFRDRSALYGRHLKKDEQPTWPTTYIN